MKNLWLLLVIFVIINFDGIFGKPNANFPPPTSKFQRRKSLFSNYLSEKSLSLRSTPGFINNNRQTLPENLKPIFYEIQFHPFFQAPGVSYDPKLDQTFTSEVTIWITVLKPTSVIVLNSYKLDYSDFKSFPLQKTKIVGMIESPENETVTFKLDRELSVNEEFALKMTVHGKIGYNSERGFYKSIKYEDIVYATMFQTRGARAVFPCFDEPKYKTEFQIFVAKPKSWTALSNGVEMGRVDIGNGYDLVTFERTEIMSTYLVAFAIGDFVKIEGKTADNTLTRVWTFRSGEKQMKAGLDAAIKCADALTNFTNIPLKYKKMDHLAIPDKQFFAMENPGLAIYDQRMLLLDDSEAINYRNPVAFNQWYRVAGTVCHEMAHQWFGNLVTNKWWGDSWLHEGFANYFETFALAKAYPNEKDLIDVRVAAATLKKVVGLDNPNVPQHPVITKDGAFDQYTYNKGGAVLRQLEAIISPGIFQQAIQHYLKTYANSNANSADFIQALQEVINEETNLRDWCGEAFNVSKFLDLWLNQVSRPYLYVEYENGTFSISQKVYNGNSWWPLPVFVQYENGKNDMFWLAPEYICKDGTKLPATKTIATSALFVNPDLISIAKMEYSPEAAKTIYNALTSNKNFLISPSSLAVFYDRIVPFLDDTHNNIFEKILEHQKSAKIYDIHLKLEMYR